MRPSSGPLLAAFGASSTPELSASLRPMGRDGGRPWLGPAAPVPGLLDVVFGRATSAWQTKGEANPGRLLDEEFLISR